MKIFLLITTFLSYANTSFAEFPPFEVVPRLTGFQLVSVVLSTNIDDIPDSKLTEAIRTQYSGLYSDKGVIDRLDCSTIKTEYPSILQYSLDENVIKFKFDIHRFIKIFQCDKELVREAFKKKPIQLIYDFKFDCKMKSKQSSDSVIHQIVFNRFFGSNPIISDNSSRIFQHIQTTNNPGQITLTDDMAQS